MASNDFFGDLIPKDEPVPTDLFGDLVGEAKAKKEADAIALTASNRAKVENQSLGGLVSDMLPRFAKGSADMLMQGIDFLQPDAAPTASESNNPIERALFRAAEQGTGAAIGFGKTLEGADNWLGRVSESVLGAPANELGALGYLGKGIGYLGNAANAPLQDARAVENARRVAAGLPTLEQETARQGTTQINRMGNTIMGAGYNDLISEEGKLADAELANATEGGILSTLSYIAQNPLTAGSKLGVESAPMMATALLTGGLTGSARAAYLAGAGMEGASAGQQTEQAIMAAPEAELGPEYARRVAAGEDAVQVRMEIARAAGDVARGGTSALVAAASFGGQRLSKAAGVDQIEDIIANQGIAGTRGRFANAAIGAPVEALSEFPEELAAAVGQNAAMVNATDGDLGQIFTPGAFGQGAAGMAIGGAAGATIGGLATPKPATEKADPKVVAAQAQFDAEAAELAEDGTITGEQVDELAARAAATHGVTVADVLRGTEAEGREAPAPNAPNAQAARPAQADLAPENDADEASADDILNALMNAGVVPSTTEERPLLRPDGKPITLPTEADMRGLVDSITGPKPVPEQGGNPEPVAPVAGSQPVAAVSPDAQLGEQFAAGAPVQPAPSPVAAGGETPLPTLSAETGQAAPTAAPEDPAIEQAPAAPARKPGDNWKDEKGRRHSIAKDGTEYVQTLDAKGDPAFKTDKRGRRSALMAPAVDWMKHDLRHWLAVRGGVNGSDLRKNADFDFALLKERNNRPFGTLEFPMARKNSGMSLEQLLVAMRDDGWLPPAPVDSPDRLDFDDVMDLVGRALNGDKPVLHPDTPAERWQQQLENSGPEQTEDEIDDDTFRGVIASLPDSIDKAIAGQFPREAVLSAWRNMVSFEQFNSEIQALIDEVSGENDQGAASDGREANQSDVRQGGSREGGQGRTPESGDQPENSADDSDIPFQRQEVANASGIPSGLPAVSTDAAGRLAKRFTAERERKKLGGKFRFQEIQQAALPDALRRALSALEAATGTRIVIVRNLTPELDKFNGVTFRDGVLYVDEKSDRPLTLVAAHEWVHQLRKDQPALYQRLEAEVRRQGNIPAWIERMRAEGNSTERDVAVEELTADAVADALTDPDFLRRVVEEGGTLRRAARSFLQFLDGMLAKVKGRNTGAYLDDVRAFRDELAAVLREYENREAQPDASRQVDDDAAPAFERRAADSEMDGDLGDGRTPTNTPAFGRWFKESEVVDEQGNPLPVYHGTGEEFDAFDRGRLATATGHASSGLGFFFTPDETGARSYADKAANYVPADAVVLEVYLSIQKPYVMTLAEAQSIEDVAEANVMRMSLQSQGFDGVHIPEQNAWVAFNANQVKRTDNGGKWNPADERMMFQRREAVDPRLAEALAEYEEEMQTAADLLDQVEFIISDSKEVPQSVIDAARRFRQEIREDADEWGGRGDSIVAGEAFEAAVSAAVSPAFQRRDSATGDLFAQPTTRERVQAEQEARDARRDGRTGTGRTDMMAGDGDLFAGPRPEQADIESGEIPAQDVSTYGTLRPLRAKEPSDAAATPAQGGRRAAAQVRGQLDMFVATRGGAAPEAGQEPAVRIDKPKFAASVKLAQIGQFGTGIERVKSIADAAHILAPLRKSPQEKLMVLALDADGRPLTVLQHTVGLIDEASVDPGTILGAIASVPGVKSVVFAHNHPSGNPQASNADRTLDVVLSRLFEGSGIEVRGSIIVQPGRRTFTAYGNANGSAGFVTTDGKITAARRRGAVSVTERRFGRVAPAGRDIITRADQAKDMVRAALADMPAGVIMLDTQNGTIGTMPFDPKATAKLRTGDVRTSHARYIADAVGANARSAIVYGPKADAEAIKNLGAAYARSGIRLLDVMLVGRGSAIDSLAEKGGLPQPSSHMFQRRLTGDVFESAALRAIEEGKGAPKRGTAEQWKGWLDGAVRRGEMKQTERDWLDVDGWLQRQGGAVTREALADYVRENQVQIEEVRPQDAARFTREMREELEQLSDIKRSDRTREQQSRLDDLQDLANREDEMAGGKFSQYQLPGGTAYREVLLTLPYKSFTPREITVVSDRLREKYGRIEPDDWTEQERADWYAEARQNDAAMDAAITPTARENYKSSHWDQPNVLAHMRLNDRTDAQGREVLFIEEIQSDWHQAGRKRGYGEAKSYKAHVYTPDSLEIYQNEFSWRVRDIHGVERSVGKGVVDTEQEAREYLARYMSGMERDYEREQSSRNSDKVPDAPMKATDEWAMLAFKRAVREAIETGKSVIAWTTGEQQAERYDMSRQVERITVGNANEEGKRPVVITTTGSTSFKMMVDERGVVEGYQAASQFSGKMLDEVIGKEMADKVMNAEPGTTLSGEDLKIGGAGMRGFYDKILPSAVNKWAKKFGGKVGMTSLDTDKKRWTVTPPSQTASGQWMVKNALDPLSRGRLFDFEEDARAEAARLTKQTAQHSLEITPSMRDAASEAMPLFQRRGSEPQTETPEFKRWFGGSKAVDANGEPLRVYHGTNQEFDSFDEGRLGTMTKAASAKAFFFTADPSEASYYADASAERTIPNAVEHEKKTARLMREMASAERRGDFARQEALTIELEEHEIGAIRADPSGAQVLPVYLSIKNPLRVNAGGSISSGVVNGHINDAIAGGHDGLILEDITDSPVFTGDKTTHYVVFKPNQIKSATGNRGTFDDSGNMLFMRRSVPQAKAEAARKRATVDTALNNPMGGGALGWNPVKSEWVGAGRAMREAREATQDKYISLRDMQEDIEAATGMELPDAQNVYRIENLMHGRVQDGILGIERKHLDPLFAAMRKAGVDAKTLEDYLYARHAEERNKHIAKINPKMPDGGSGMTTKAARDALNAADTAKLEPLAKRVDALMADTRKRLLDSGVITRDQYDAMEAQYKHYIPLRGIDESKALEVADRGGGMGRGIEQRSSGIKKAAGRSTLAVNLLGEAMADAQRAVIAAEKARVGRALARLVLANPSPNLWEVEAVRTERKFDAQGQVYEAIVNESAEPDVVHVLIQGKPYRVRIVNHHAIQALKNLGANEMFKFMRPLAAMNRWVSASLTSYNPGFTAVNMTRDLVFGTTRILAEDGAATYASTVAGYGPAMKALTLNEANAAGNKPMDKRLREFLGAGGKTGWVSMNAVEDLQRGVWLDTSGQLTARGLRGLREIGRFVESANVVVENAMRLAYFSALRDRGMSVDKAAERAKNLTLNFNRKGRFGNELSAAYLFFNPAIQGTHVLAKLAKNPKALGMVGTLAAAQAMFAMLAAGIEDEDGETLASKVPEYIKERNLWAVIPGDRDPTGKLLPGEKDRLVTLPMPFGFNVLPYSASVGVDVWTKDMAEIASGAKSPVGVAASIVGRLTNAFVGATAPVPLNDGLVGLIPTIPGQIIGGLITNKDSLGRTIRQPQFDLNNPEPLAYNPRPETPQVFVEMAQALNWLGGGDEFRRPVGVLDRAPEDFEYLWEWVVGGAGRFATDTATGGYNFFNDPEANENKGAPIAKAFTQPLNEQGAALGAYYQRADSIEEQAKRIRTIAARDGLDAAIEHADSVPFMAGVIVREKSNGDIEIRPGGSDVYDAYRKAQSKLRALRAEERLVYEEQGRGIINVERAKLLRDIRAQRVEAVKDVNLFWNEAVRPLSE